MPKMRTTVSFELDLPGASHAEMQQAEAMMRDPNYVEAVSASINIIANLHAANHGFPRPVKITGQIEDVTHT